MEEYIVQGALGLARGSMLRIEDGRDILIHVREGEVWLTEECERRDRILRAGEWHRLERQGAAIAYAFGRSVLTLTAPEPVRYARRIVLVRPSGAERVVLYSATRERAVGLAARSRAALWLAMFAPRPSTTDASR